MDFYRRYSLVIGLFILTCIVVLLLSTSVSIFSRGVSFIDTELNRSSGHEAYVRTKMDFGNSEHVKAFPTEINDWRGYDYDASEYEKLLGADVILLRGYTAPGIYQPIFLTIMQAKTESSFHPPPICYVAQGYELDEEGKEEFLVSDTSWAEEGAFPTQRPIPVRTLVASKESKGEVTERRVVIYYYVKGNKFTSNTITMIEIAGLAPINGSYQGILQVEKDFAAQTFPYMFNLEEENKKDTVAAQLAHWGAGGYLVIVLSLGLPLAVIIYPRIKKPRRTDIEPEPQK